MVHKTLIRTVVQVSDAVAVEILFTLVRPRVRSMMEVASEKNKKSITVEYRFFHFRMFRTISVKAYYSIYTVVIEVRFHERRSVS